MPESTGVVSAVRLQLLIAQVEQLHLAGILLGPLILLLVSRHLLPIVLLSRLVLFLGLGLILFRSPNLQEWRVIQGS